MLPLLMLGGAALSGVFNSKGPGVEGLMGQTDLGAFGNAPGSSALQNSLASMGKFQPLGQEAAFQGSPSSFKSSAYKSSGTPFKENAYQAKDMSNQVMPQYDAMRTRLNSQYTQQQSQSQDALDRQFAASGGGPGNGAQMKQTQNLSEGIARQKGQDLLGINAQEAQAKSDLQNRENDRAYQSGEAQKGYGFQAGQAEIGREFQHGQQQQGYQFQAGEAAAGRDFQGQQAVASRNQQTNQFNAQMGQQQNQFMFDANSKIAGINLDYQKAQADRVDNEFNKKMAEYQARHSGGLLGAGGFLGTGIGA